MSHSGFFSGIWCTPMVSSLCVIKCPQSQITWIGAGLCRVTAGNGETSNGTPLILHDFYKSLLHFRHGLATKEGCWMRRKSRNLKYAMGVRSTGFTTQT
jgi:hypothetical protein